MRFLTIICIAIISFRISVPVFAGKKKQDNLFRKTEDNIILNDDLDFRSLKTSVEKTISYYKKLSDNILIKYPDTSFTKDEILYSLDRFLRICEIENKKIRMLAFNRDFEILSVHRNTDKVLFTGYYEESVPGSNKRSKFFNTPVYGRPDDLVYIGSRNDGRILFGKKVKNRVIPYDTRKEISSYNSIEGKADIICYLNKIDLFFLQIEGSGKVRFNNGEIFYLNYDSDNGRDYKPVTAVFKDPSISKSELIRHLKNNPGQTDNILNKNPRYVFFHASDMPSRGNLGESLVPGRSIAADPEIYPMGAIAYINVKSSEFGNKNPINRFVCIHDAGAAIKGSGRVDLFFGTMEDKGESFKSRGDIYLIVPKKSSTVFKKLAQGKETEKKEFN